MNKNLIPFLLVGSALLTGCNQQQPTTDTPATVAPPVAAPATANVSKADAVAIVNGTPISKATFKTLEDEIALRTHGQKFPKQQLLEELIQRELLVQDAQKKHLDQSTEVKERIDMAERSLLSQADLQDYLKTNPITDAEIKAEYDKEVAKMAGTEYKARHILVKTEEEAKKLIAELTKGAKFEELAKKHSLDPSKEQGGDLGWFTEGQMVEPFSKAVAGLEKGKFTLVPVQTQFGWHVILREDSRPQVPPPFDTIKEQLRPALQQQKVQKMLEDLRKNAQVETLMSFEEPKPEVPAPAASVPTDGTAATPPATTESNPQPVDASKPAEPAAKTDSAVPAGDKATTGSTDAAKPSEAPTEAAKTESTTVPADKAGAESSAKPVEPAKK
jgi:peptidyl-prolyl cis-trans isomerase C